MFVMILIKPVRSEHQGCYWLTVPPQWGGERLFWLKSEFLGPQKRALLDFNQPGKVVQKKSTIFPNRYQSFNGCFFEEKKQIFGLFSAFLQNIKTALSPYICPGPGPLSMWVIFVVAQTVSPSFVDHGPKLILILAKMFFQFNRDLGFFIRYDTILIDIFGLRN